MSALLLASIGSAAPAAAQDVRPPVEEALDEALDEGVEAVAEVLEEAEAWIDLQIEQVHIRCREGARGSECEATADLEAGVDAICDIARNLAEWPSVFGSVRRTEAVGPDTWAVQVHLPFPLGQRNFVAQVEHRADEHGHSVTLTHTEGKHVLWTWATWQVTPRGEGSRVAYRWHTPALSALPSWIRRPLLRSSGLHVVWGIATAAGTRPRFAVAQVEEEPG